MKDRWGMLPLDEPRCEGCGEPLNYFPIRERRCDKCTLLIVRAFNAVDRAVKAGKAA